MADAKQKDSQAAEATPELPIDREQGLALQFEDLGLSELMPAEPSAEAAATAEPAPTSLVAEVAEAVHELVMDFGSVPPVSFPEFAPEATGPLAPEFNHEAAPTPEFSVDGLAFEGAEAESAAAAAKIAAAERFFELLLAEKSFNDLNESLLQALLQAASGSAGSLLELDHERDEFFFRASVGGGDPEKLRSFRVPASKGIVGHVAESRQPLLLNDMEGDELQLRAISMSTGYEIESCVALPVLIQNRLFGVVELFNKAGGGKFLEADLPMLEECVRMAAKVLEVRFLMAELARRVR